VLVKSLLFRDSVNYGGSEGSGPGGPK